MSGNPQQQFRPRVQFNLNQLFIWVTFASVALALGAIVGVSGILFAGAVIFITTLWMLGRISVVELGVLIIVGIVLLMALLPYAMVNRGPSFGSTCGSHLRQLGIAIANYEAAYHSLPPAYVADANGRPMHSWRVLILPYIEEQELYDEYDFNEPWDGPNNSKLHDRMPQIFRCPGDESKNPQATSYLCVVGSDTAWPGATSRKLSDFADGGRDTILLVESCDSGIHWLEPRDLDMRSLPLQINPPNRLGIHSHHHGGANCVFCDCHGNTLPADTPKAKFKEMLQFRPAAKSSALSP